MPAKKQNKKSIKNADIRIGRLPPGCYPSGISPEEQLFCIYIDQDVLQTPQGNVIYHKDDKPLREVATELEFMDTLDVYKPSLFSLCSSQIDFMEQGEGCVSREDLHEWLLNDVALRTCSGPEVIDQMKYMRVIQEFLNEFNIQYPNLPQIPLGKFRLEFSRVVDDPNEYVDADMEEFYTYAKDKNFNKLVDQFYLLLDNFDMYQKTVFTVCMAVFGSVTLSIMLILRAISPKEFAINYMLANGVSEKVWGGNGRKKERDMFNEIHNIAECMNRYLALFPPQLSEIEKLIQNGESKQLEFKSTLRWNLIANRQDPAIEHSVLKSIVAFLNTDGGTLLVGVNDDGVILGIQEDKFPNDDKFLLHFSNILNTRIGKRYADLVKWDLVSVNNKKVLRVNCDRGSSPVFLKTDGHEEFFVRTGPSTVQLSASEILDYSKRRFLD